MGATFASENWMRIKRKPVMAKASVSCGRPRGASMENRPAVAKAERKEPSTEMANTFKEGMKKTPHKAVHVSAGL